VAQRSYVLYDVFHRFLYIAHLIKEGSNSK
jgi:hypothetical protein